MDGQPILEFLQANSLIIIFVIMFLEGLNLTGIPAIVILPTLGVLAAQGYGGLVVILGIAIFGSIAGNVVYYIVIRMIGPKVYDWVYERFKRLRKSLDKGKELMERYGKSACLIGRVIPGVRTVTSLVAGTFKVKFSSFLIYSAIGIIVWDGILIVCGFLIGQIN